MEELIELLKGVKSGVDYSKPGLVTGGIFDSITIFTVIAKIEKQYDIKIRPKDVTPANFDSVTAIYELIERVMDEE